VTDPIGATGNATLAQILAASNASTAAQATAAKTAPGKEDLDKDAFLKLLVAQLKYQDPSNPAQGTEFLAQTAQFTQVEKLSDLADVQKEMLTAQLTLGAASLIGRTVTYTDASGNTASGVVDGATIGSSPSVHIGGADGFDVDMSKVSRVGVTTTAATTPAATTAPPATTAPTTTGPTTTGPATTGPATTAPATTGPAATTEPAATTTEPPVDATQT
jgi:flagellar basal-body rod modification protein FlgD